MPDVYLVIGNRYTGKSSTVRCLTGVGKSAKVSVKLTGGNDIDVYVKPQSLQEACEDDQYAISQYGNYPKLLLSLWVRHRRGKYQCPDAGGYLSSFLQARWNIVGVVALGGGVPNVITPFVNNGQIPRPVVVTPRTANNAIPANAMAAPIRRAWGWV